MQIFAIAALSLALLACATVPATVTQPPREPLLKQGQLYLAASVQRPRIAQSLRKAGLIVVDQPSEANYVLHVELGSRRSRERCGTKNNVNYLLFDGGRRVVIVKGRGWTGTCVPNIFDEMSRALAPYFPPLDPDPAI